jgi:inhibitor of KinA sporulation pathway (predicted exonuclease)
MIEVYIVVDFEATCKKTKLISPQEIIEFPALLVDARTLRVLSRFHSYIKPSHNPELSRFCTRLTGITQSQVDSAPPFSEVMIQHHGWLKENKVLGLGGEMAYVTWGDWDFMSAFPNQCDISSVEIPEWATRWINLKQIVTTYMGVPKRCTLKDLVTRYLGLEWQGREHSGMDDCVNTVSVLRNLVQSGVKPYITSVLNSTGRSQWRAIQEGFIFKNRNKETEAEGEL